MAAGRKFIVRFLEVTEKRGDIGGFVFKYQREDGQEPERFIEVRISRNFVQAEAAKPGGLAPGDLPMIAAGVVKEHLLGTLNKEQVRYDDEQTIVVMGNYQPQEIIEATDRFEVELPTPPLGFRTPDL